MRKYLVAAALGLASVGAMAQVNYQTTFKLESAQTNTVVGSGYFGWMFTNPAEDWLLTGSQTLNYFVDDIGLSLSTSKVGVIFFADSASVFDGKLVAAYGSETDELSTHPETIVYASIGGPSWEVVETVNGVQTYSDSGAVIYAQAVPEPSAYALLLGGLGAVGFMYRRSANRNA